MDVGSEEAPVRVDPLGDLFLSAASLVLALLLVSLAALPSRPAAEPATPPAASAPTSTTADLLYAGAGGALYGATGTSLPLDALADDAALGLWLDQHRARDTPLLLVIAADGGETAVALEPLLAARGPSAIAVARLPGRCPASARLDGLRTCLAAAGLDVAAP